jgi:hypothetical protein
VIGNRKIEYIFSMANKEIKLSSVLDKEFVQTNYYRSLFSFFLFIRKICMFYLAGRHHCGD